MPSPKELAKALARQDSVTQQPRNRFLGAIADAAGYVSDQADRYVVPERDPLFGGMRGGDLLPLRNVNRLLDDLSYGGRITTGRGQTAALRPEVVDLAGVTGAMMPVSKGLGKAALREAALDPRMSVSHGLLDTTGLENRGRDLIRGKAEELAQRMHEAGVTVDLQHSGSAAGPSSYIKVVGMPDIRISGHSKGAFNSGGVLNVASPEEFDNVLAMAIKKQQKYNSQKALMEKMYEDAAIPIRLKSADKKIAKGLKLTNSEQDAVNVRAMPKPIDVGGAMMQRPKTEFEILHDTAQRNAALPVEQGGLGLPSGNSYMDRAGAMGAVDYLHGTQRLDRLLSGKNLDPKRATSGPMPFGTDTPPVASGYAMNKQDTSRMASNTGDLAESFQVSPKSLGLRGKNPYTVEQSWHHLSPEVKADILDKSRRIGYENPAQGEGAWVLHPTSQGAPFSPSHFDYELKAAKGNPLAALRSAYGESGMLDAYAPSELADIYKLAGYPHEISQANAPWTSAQGVLTGKAMINNPLKTSNVEEIRSTVIPALKEAFKNDRTRLKTSGSDEWAKDARYTPKDWVNQLEQDLAKGDNSYVWTSIPDKVTDQIKKLGYQGIIDTGGKGGDLYGHQVVIPFQPSQVRSRFAAFDPMRRHEADILAGVGVGGMLDPQAIAEALRGRK